MKSVGNIRCRLNEGSEDLRGLGYILERLTRGTIFSPHFYLQENFQGLDEKEHEIPIPVDTIRNMCSRGSFQLPTNLAINGSGQSSLTRISLRLQSQPYGKSYNLSYGGSMRHTVIEPYLSISGFPRELWTQDNAMSPPLDLEDQRDNISNPWSPDSFLAPSAVPRSVSDPEVPTVLRKTRSRFMKRSSGLSAWTTQGHRYSDSNVASLTILEDDPEGMRSSTETDPTSPATKSLLY